MSNNAVRLSPSGPVIANAAGGPFTPGSGAQLRLVEAASSGTQSLVVAPGAGLVQGDGSSPLIVALLAPDPKKQYRATVICDVENDATNITAVVQLYIDLSPDGVTWTQVAADGHLVGFSSMRQVRCDLLLTPGVNLGAALGVNQVVMRGRISKSGAATPFTSAGGTVVGTYNGGPALIQLAECF
jgi:hypothetical protein